MALRTVLRYRGGGCVVLGAVLASLAYWAFTVSDGVPLPRYRQSVAVVNKVAERDFQLEQATYCLRVSAQEQRGERMRVFVNGTLLEPNVYPYRSLDGGVERHYFRVPPESLADGRASIRVVYGMAHPDRVKLQVRRYRTQFARGLYLGFSDNRLPPSIFDGLFAVSIGLLTILLFGVVPMWVEAQEFLLRQAATRRVMWAVTPLVIWLLLGGLVWSVSDYCLVWSRGVAALVVGLSFTGALVAVLWEQAGDALGWVCRWGGGSDVPIAEGGESETLPGFGEESGYRGTFLFWVACGIGLLVAVLSPVLTYEYLYHDDWLHFGGHGQMREWFQIMGRPIGHELLCLQYKLVENIEAGWRGRLVTVGALSVLLLCTSVFLRRHGYPAGLAVAIALGVTVLPGCLVFAFWLGSGFVVFGLLAAAVSALLCQTALMRKSPYGPGFWLLLLLAAIVESTAFLIYQTAGMFFLVFAAVALANRYSGSIGSLFRTGFVYGLVVVTASCAYFVGFSYMVADRLAQANPERGVSVANLWDSTHWFFTSALMRALRIWFANSVAAWIPWCVGLAFIVAFLAFVVVRMRISEGCHLAALKAGAIYAGLMFVLGIGCFSPMLLASFRLEVFRSLVPLSAFVVVLTSTHTWLIVRSTELRWSVAGRLLLPVVVALGFFTHNMLLETITLPRSAEVTFLRDTMRAAASMGRGSWPVHVIVPKITYSWRTDEIGSLSAHFHQDVVPMLSLIRSELKLPQVPITTSVPGEPLDARAQVVADLSVLALTGIDAATKKEFRFLGLPEVSVGSPATGGAHPVGLAFDGRVDVNSFWETAFSSPVVIDLAYEEHISIESYAFVAGETAERMPTRWRLQGSSDGNVWKDIDSHDGFADWKPNEERRFSVSEGLFSHYRFVFEESASRGVMRIYEIDLVMKPVASCGDNKQ